MKNEEMVYKLTNREKKMKSRKNLFWCYGCDRQIVGEWEKCPVCGIRNGVKRFKKGG